MAGSRLKMTLSLHPCSCALQASLQLPFGNWVRILELQKRPLLWQTILTSLLRSLINSGLSMSPTGVRGSEGDIGEGEGVVALGRGREEGEEVV